MKLAVAIVGDADANYDNVFDLLNDFFPISDNNYIVYVPNYIKSQGLKTVVSCLEDLGTNYEKVLKSSLVDCLTGLDADKKVLIINGHDGIDDLINSAMAEGHQILDLEQGLWELPAHGDPQMALGSPESDSKTQTDGSGIPVRVNAQNGSQRLAELNDFIPNLYARVEKLEKEVEKLRAHVGTNETGFQPEIIRSGIKEPDYEEVINSATEGKILYFKSQSGKFRKAGKSKKRPRETEVWMSQEEIDALN